MQIRSAQVLQVIFFSFLPDRVQASTLNVGVRGVEGSFSFLHGWVQEGKHL